MSKKKLMTIVGIVMMVCGVGTGVFGVAMRSTWSSQAQTPKIYDWNNEDIGQAPSVDDSDDIDIKENDIDKKTDTDETKTDNSDTSEADATDNTDTNAEGVTEGE